MREFFNKLLGRKEQKRGPGEMSGREQTPERNLAINLLKDFRELGLHPLENEKLYEYIGRLPEAKLASLLKRFEKAWYSPGEDSKKLIDSLGKKFLPCLFHPGVAIRLDNFISHVQKLNQRQGGNEISPLDAIKSFSNELGVIQLYRGMALLPSEADALTKKGILPHPIDRDTSAITSLLNAELPPKSPSDSKGPSRSFSDDIMSRTTDFIDRSTTISVSTSEYPEVALSAGWQDATRKSERGVVPILFSIKIPRILCYQMEDMVGDYRGPSAVVIGEKKFPRQGLEFFVPFGVSPSWIVNVEQKPVPLPWKSAR